MPDGESPCAASLPAQTSTIRNQSMPVTLITRPENSRTGTKRKSLAERVIKHFASSLSCRMLCFLDDQDASVVRLDRGAANRGFYLPVDENVPLNWLPEYVTSRVYVDDGVSMFFPRVVDELIYLHGTTCADDVGLVLTLAHELQHAVQHGKARNIWAVNTLVTGLDRKIITKLNLSWSDIPIELDARLVSKRVAEGLFGAKLVCAHIDKKIAEQITEADAAEWTFMKALDPATSVDVASATQSLFWRLKDYRSELEAVLEEVKNSSDYNCITLDCFFGTDGRQNVQMA